jgi:hypothetical protein
MQFLGLLLISSGQANQDLRASLIPFIHVSSEGEHVIAVGNIGIHLVKIRKLAKA